MLNAWLNEYQRLDKDQPFRKMGPRATDLSLFHYSELTAGLPKAGGYINRKSIYCPKQTTEVLHVELVVLAHHRIFVFNTDIYFEAQV